MQRWNGDDDILRASAKIKTTEQKTLVAVYGEKACVTMQNDTFGVWTAEINFFVANSLCGADNMMLIIFQGQKAKELYGTGTKWAD